MADTGPIYDYGHDHVPPPEVIRRRANADRWADAIDEWTNWMRASGASPGTVRVRRWYLRGLAADHLDSPPWKLATADLAAWLAGRGWHGETLKNGRASLRSFYRWAHADGLAHRDPSAGLPPVRVPVGLPRPADETVFLAALAAADQRGRLMLLFARRAGLRDAEIAGLSLAEAGRAVRSGALVVRGKGGRERSVPLAADLRRALAGELERRAAGDSGTGWRYRAGLDAWLFPGMSGGGPMRADSLGRVVARALGRRATAHQLRHSFASAAYAGTRDLRAVQELLGHRRPETTARYTAVPEDAAEAAVRAAS